MSFTGPVFEAINIAWAILGICLLAIFSRYLFGELRLHGFRTRTSAAVAINIFVLGGVIRAMWTATYRWLQSHGPEPLWMMSGVYGLIPVVGASIAAGGLLYMIHVFAPDDCGRRAWITSALITIVLTCALMFF